MTASDETDLVTTVEAAEILGILPSTVRLLTSNGTIDVIKRTRVGNWHRREDVEAYRDRRKDLQGLAKAPARKLMARYNGVRPPHIDPLEWSLCEAYARDGVPLAALLPSTTYASREAVRLAIARATAEVYDEGDS